MGKLAMQYNRQAFDKVIDKLQNKYDITPLTPYQWRFNNKIDIYPSNCKYFEIDKQFWGEYYSNNKLEKFLEAYFKGEVL
jgi:hypothetical protein